MLRLRPISLRDANEYVRKHHRHHKPVAGHKFSIGCEADGELVGVIIAGRPVSRYLDDGFTLEVIGMRLLCATGEKHTYAETQISLSCEGYEFKAKGKTVVQNGWKAIEELFKASLKTKEKDDPMKSLPEVHEGDVLDNVSASVTEHFTTPPKQYTEDTLLSAMETAGNDQFDDDTEKKGL